MNLTYSDLPEYQFPYWIGHETTPGEENFNYFMDVNQWCGEQFGDLGKTWGYERKSDSSGAPAGLNPVRVRLHYTKILYSWRFKNKEDAMMFKLTFGGK